MNMSKILKSHDPISAFVVFVVRLDFLAITRRSGFLNRYGHVFCRCQLKSMGCRSSTNIVYLEPYDLNRTLDAEYRFDFCRHIAPVESSEYSSPIASGVSENRISLL